MLQFVLGIIFAALATFGHALDATGAIPWRELKFWMAMLVLSIIISVALVFLWRFLALAEIFSQSSECGFFRRRGLMIIILLASWAPCYLSIFPGGFVYDATVELAQAENGFNGNFPRLHSLIITKLLGLTAAHFQSYEAGVAIYAVAQMTLLAAVYAQIFRFFSARGANSKLLAVLFVYCAIFPVVPMLATATVRDVLFAVLLTWAAFLAYEGEAPVLFGVVLALTLTARSNNAGFLPLVILVAVVIYVRRARFAVAVLGTFFALNMLLAAICQPFVPANVESSMSVFAQGLARAYVLAPETFTESEREKFRWYFGEAEIKYVPENADPVKSRLDVHGDAGEFLKFWLEIGMKNSVRYVEAFLANSRQMWYPPSVIDGYQRAGVDAYEPYDKCYYAFGYTEPPVVGANLLPRVKNFYERIGLFISFEEIPAVSLLFSIGFQFWLLIHCAFYAAYRRARRLFLPLAILLAYAILSAFVPLVLLRYFAALFLAFPLVVLLTLAPPD